MAEATPEFVFQALGQLVGTQTEMPWTRHQDLGTGHRDEVGDLAHPGSGTDADGHVAGPLGGEVGGVHDRPVGKEDRHRVVEGRQAGQDQGEPSGTGLILGPAHPLAVGVNEGGGLRAGQAWSATIPARVVESQKPFPVELGNGRLVPNAHVHRPDPMTDHGQSIGTAGCRMGGCRTQTLRCRQRRGPPGATLAGDNWDPGLTVREWWARLAGSGWGFPTWPAEWFGRGLTDAEGATVGNEIAGAGVLGPPAAASARRWARPCSSYTAPRTQKRRWLPVIAHGEEKWCQFFSEPGAGSDLASLQTRAVQDGDDWIVNGQKVWTSGTTLADRGCSSPAPTPMPPSTMASPASSSIWTSRASRCGRSGK